MAFTGLRDTRFPSNNEKHLSTSLIPVADETLDSGGLGNVREVVRNAHKESLPRGLLLGET
jgi:hypothetical protein